MINPNRFAYRSLDDLLEDIARRGLSLPISHDLSVLSRSAAWGRRTIPNRMSVQPMEGCDAEPDGTPDELTVRRYKRFAAGGAGLIWWEACAVVPEGRANPRQLWLNEGSAGGFRAMLESARHAARESMGQSPVCVLQLAHSGRYSRPVDKPKPIIAAHVPALDRKQNFADDLPVITDDELERLQDAYVRAAVLAADVGFDAVDVKCCHRYLLSELLGAYQRPGRFGGGYDGRTRMLRETVAKVQQAVGKRIEVTCRMNVYDAIAYPFGWGVHRDDPSLPDLAEPVRLIGQLGQMGVECVNVTAGNPYFNPHVNRPADWMIAGWPDAPEHPLAGVARLAGLVGAVQKACSGTLVVGTGYSWLRQYFPQFAAGAIKHGDAGVVGLGRGALAYPDFAKDVLRGGTMDGHKVCVACSSCTQIMRDGGRSGCVVRDSEVYGPIFRRGRLDSAEMLRDLASRCRLCADAMCTTGCPAGVDIPGFLGALADGDEKQAYEILRSRNVLPAICGAVCPADMQCQSACIQRVLADSPLPIAEIQKQLSRRGVEAGWASVEIPQTCSGKHVAVVGAGPAGLSAAAELLRLGHRVMVFEQTSRAGGKLGAVIPSWRLSEAQTQAEIRAVFGRSPADRLTWRYCASLGDDVTLEELSRSFDAVVLAMGLGAAATGGDKRPAGVLEASDFLRQMNANPKHQVPRRVAVIGGGNSASDAAVCAKTRGAEDVFLLYRRGYQQMPAWPKERIGVLDSGVHLMVLCQAISYEADESGRLTGVRAVRTELGQADESGRRRPRAVAGSEFVLPVDLAIEALGERPTSRLSQILPEVQLTPEGLVAVNPQTLATSRRGVWAAGDVVNGGTTVVRAVAEGRSAAQDIAAHLSSSAG